MTLDDLAESTVWKDGADSPTGRRILWIEQAAGEVVSVSGDPNVALYVSNGCPVEADLATCLPESAKEIRIDWLFDADELPRLREGIKSGVMEDKWMIGPAEDGKKLRLCLFRSWTGRLVYVVEIEESRAQRLWFAESDAFEPARTVRALLDGYLLGKPCIVPAPAELGDDRAKLFGYGVSLAGRRCTAVEPVNVR